jgi:tRNA(adenine34) deaminase
MNIAPSQQDQVWLSLALQIAKKVAQRGEVPVGAVLVKNNQLLAKAGNSKENLKTPLGHAEVLALHRAAQKLSAWRLTGTTLYVTLEPCLMCVGALIQARVERVVFGALDPKAGALVSVVKTMNFPQWNHHFTYSGPMDPEGCGGVLKEFFSARRLQNKGSL